MGLRSWLGLKKPKAKKPKAGVHSQFGEDRILFNALSHVSNGFYIDVGAMDPHDMSVTRLFYDQGWSGINVEPVPKYFDLLTQHRPRDINLRVAATTFEGTLDIHVMEGGLTTSDAKLAQGHASKGIASSTISVPATTMARICEQYRPEGDIHFMKVDVEGAEASVLEGCDFTRYRPWVLAIEAVVPLTKIPSHGPWEPLLLQAGYEFVLFADINRYYVARERLSEITIRNVIA